MNKRSECKRPLNHFRRRGQIRKNNRYCREKMYFSTFFFILSAFKVYSSNAGPIATKLKLAKTLTTEKDACPPGVWTCSTGKRSDIVFSKSPENSLMQFQTSKRACPPGLWTCSTGKRSEITNEAPVTTKAPHNKSEPDREDSESCSQGIRICRKMRLFKRMLKKETFKLKLSQASKEACPPGVWTCPTGRR